MLVQAKMKQNESKSHNRRYIPIIPSLERKNSIPVALKKFIGKCFSAKLAKNECNQKGKKRAKIPSCKESIVL